MLVVAAAISWQFGRTRIVYLSLLLLALLLQDHIAATFFNFQPSILFTSCILTSTLLMLDKDRGIKVNTSLIYLVVFVLLTVFADFLWQLSHNVNAVSSDSSFINHLVAAIRWVEQLYAGLSNTISAQLTGDVFVLYGVVIIAALVRLVWLPTNTHTAIFVTIISLVYLQFQTSETPISTVLLHSVILTLSGIFILSALIDSHNMAFKDELTGIPSRRALMQYVPTLGRKYVVVMADVDHFKKFNDTYGHDVGDQVLKLVAAKLNQVTGGGKAFRYGGEEFTLVFPNKSNQEVVPHLDVLRQAIADYDIVLRGKDRPVTSEQDRKTKTPAKQKTVNVTISLGLASRSKEMSEFHAIMKQADEALYRAKKAGRNCVKE